VGYVKTLFTGATGLAVGAHFAEDIGLLSIGRFAPLPWWAAFAIGIGFSWLVMGAIIYQVKGRAA
jgi:hypothetical protein